MKILVNTASLRSGGGLQVALSLLEEFGACGEHQFEVLLSPQLAALLGTEPPANTRYHRLEGNPGQSLRQLLVYRRMAARVEKAFRPDAVLTVFGPAWRRPRAPHLVGFANGLYLFHQSEFIRRIWPETKAARYRYRFKRWLLLRQLLRESSALWVETETARTALSALDPGKRIAVFGNTHAAHFSGAVASDSSPAGTETFRLLTVCAPHPNKNLQLIAAILPLLDDGAIAFTVTLPEVDFRRIFGPLAGHPALHNAGPVHPAELPRQYAIHDAVFLPSWLETFSASYPEAMAVRRPILASDLPFAREICGDAACYFPPDDPQAALAAIRSLQSDPVLQARLVAAGTRRLSSFITARDRAHRLLQLLTELADRHRTVT